MILFAMRVVRVRSPLSNRTSIIIKDESSIYDRNIFVLSHLIENMREDKVNQLSYYAKY